MPRRLSPRSRRTLAALRAIVAGAAAVVVTFTQERSGEFSTLVFQAFLVATLGVLVAELILRRGGVTRLLLAAAAVLGAILTVALPGGADERFHFALLTWAAAAGIVELVGGLVARRSGSDEAREQVAIGALTCVLAVATLLVSPGYTLDYFIDEAGQWFTLTGTIISVGLFGGWAAIVAVYTGIGALSPAPPAATATKEPA